MSDQQHQTKASSKEEQEREFNSALLKVQEQLHEVGFEALLILELRRLNFSLKSLRK